MEETINDDGYYATDSKYFPNQIIRREIVRNKSALAAVDADIAHHEQELKSLRAAKQFHQECQASLYNAMAKLTGEPGVSYMENGESIERYFGTEPEHHEFVLDMRNKGFEGDMWVCYKPQED